MSSNAFAKLMEGARRQAFLGERGSPLKRSKSLLSSSSKKRKTQSVLNLGQKMKGLIRCSECSMQYMEGQLDDEKMHKSFHKQSSMPPKLIAASKYKKYSVTSTGNVLHLTASNCSIHWKDLLSAIEMMYRDLGSDVVELESENMFSQFDHLFLSIDKNGRIVGAFMIKMLNGVGKMYDVNSNAVKECKMNTKIGVLKMWVHRSCRRQSIARILLDTIRTQIQYGVVIPKEHVAFTVPTEQGKQFIASYTGNSEFPLCPE